MKDLIIIGASGFGREVAWLVERINKKEQTWNLLGFLDDNEEIQCTTVNGYPVLGTIHSVTDYQDAYYVCAIGASKVREKVINRVKEIKQLAPNITLEIDGGINNETINYVKDKVNIVVSGSYITNSNNFQETINELKNCVFGYDEKYDFRHTLNTIIVRNRVFTTNEDGTYYITWPFGHPMKGDNVDRFPACSPKNESITVYDFINDYH